MSKPKIKWVSIGSPEHVKIEQLFDEATGGAPRLLEGSEKATDETDILRHKIKRQREIIEKIIKSAPWSNEKASSFLVLDDMSATLMRLGALELTNKKRDQLEASRSGRRGGKGRGKQLSEAVNKNEKRLTLKLGKEIQREDPTILVQERLVEKLIERWPGGKHCPESQLPRYVREFQRDGKLLASKQFRARNSRSAG